MTERKRERDGKGNGKAHHLLTRGQTLQPACTSGLSSAAPLRAGCRRLLGPHGDLLWPLGVDERGEGRDRWEKRGMRRVATSVAVGNITYGKLRLRKGESMEMMCV